MTDLRTRYLGLDLRSPIVASAGPMTGHLDRLADLSRAGVGAVVLPSLFQEQIGDEPNPDGRTDADLRGSGGARAAPIGAGDASPATDVDSYLALVEGARRTVDVPVIASLNGTTAGGWVRCARLIEEAGADALELNLYAVAADPTVRGASIEEQQLDLVSVVCAEVAIPVAVKISPYYTSVAAFAVDVQEAGARGIVMFNRFYLPDLDLGTFSIEPRIALSTQAELRLPLRWIAVLRNRLTISIAGSTGVHTGRGAAKLLSVGADVVMTTSALLHHGAGHVGALTDELVAWMRRHGYESLDALRSAALRGSSGDPADERAGYISNITSYTSRFIGSMPSSSRRTARGD